MLLWECQSVAVTQLYFPFAEPLCLAMRHARIDDVTLSNMQECRASHDRLKGQVTEKDLSWAKRLSKLTMSYKVGMDDMTFLDCE